MFLAEQPGAIIPLFSLGPITTADKNYFPCI